MVIDLYQPSRSTNLRKASHIPGTDENYALDYVKSPATKAAMPSGYNEGEQMHHLVPAELFGAFVQNLSRQEAEIVINRANELGIRVGNDPANFIGLDKMTEHLRNDTYDNTVHSQLDDIGLESTELSGSNRAQFRGLLNKIASSDVKTRLAALPDFVTYIAEPSIEIGRSFRPSAQGLEANKKQYQQEVKEEASRELRDHYRDLGSGDLPTKLPSGDAQGAQGGKELTQMIKNIKSGIAVVNAIA